MANRVVVVVDMQNGVLASPRFDRAGRCERINQLTAAADQVIFIQHVGPGLEVNSAGWAIVPELQQPANAIFVNKPPATVSGKPISPLNSTNAVLKASLFAAARLITVSIPPSKSAPASAITSPSPPMRIPPPTAPMFPRSSKSISTTKCGPI